MHKKLHRIKKKGRSRIKTCHVINQVKVHYFWDRVGEALEASAHIYNNIIEARWSHLRDAIYNSVAPFLPMARKYARILTGMKATDKN